MVYLPVIAIGFPVVLLTLQLLKFVPSPEDIDSIEANVDELEIFGETERFYYEMTRVNHYAQRVESLYFQRKFYERVEEVRPKITRKS